MTADATGLHGEDGAGQPALKFALWAAILLALNAGYINAIGLLRFFNLAVSYVTGPVASCPSSKASCAIQLFVAESTHIVRRLVLRVRPFSLVDQRFFAPRWSEAPRVS